MSDKLVRLKNAVAIGDKGDIRLTVETEDGELDVECDRADIASLIEYLLKAASIAPSEAPHGLVPLDAEHLAIQRGPGEDMLTVILKGGFVLCFRLAKLYAELSGVLQTTNQGPSGKKNLN